MAGLFGIIGLCLLLTSTLAYLADSGAYAQREHSLRLAVELLRRKDAGLGSARSRIVYESQVLVLYRPYGAPASPINMLQVQFKAPLPWLGDVLHILGKPAWFRRNPPGFVLQRELPGATLYYPTLHLAVQLAGRRPLSPDSSVLSITFSEAIRTKSAFWVVCQAWAGLIDS